MHHQQLSRVRMARDRAAQAGARRSGASAILAVGAVVFAVASVGLAGAPSALAQSSVRPPDNAVQNLGPPANPSVRQPGVGGLPEAVDPTAGRGDVINSDVWRQVRRGVSGTVSIPDKNAGQLVQSDGELWRNLRNGPLARYGVWGMGGMLALLALFFLVRGRIRLEHGWAGETITRFSSLERTGHWLLATSFVVLGLTGLNTLYGRYVLEPLLGKASFAAMTALSKVAHNYVAFAFMAGLALTFVMWVTQNFPNRHDIIWLLKGGGMFVRGSHPPARKFNAGQKILFWLIMLGGVSISLSGIALLFPFQTALFAKTFGMIEALGFGLGLPQTLTPVQEMQYATTWHGIVAIFLVCVIFAHIYIGTLGMEGAFDAMGSGEVDVNWAKEHHSLWADEVLSRDAKSDATRRPQPAE